jgi:2-polyprenyl-6-methoxyphenol hydroxylase-like FAD-dependent oxidoreductase
VQLSPDSEPVLAQIDSFDDLLVATYRDVRLARLNYGNVAYVGDSAHAMSPQLGQCSNLALLDALALADALRDEHNIERALSVYSKARKAQLSYYGFVNRALTQFFQGDSRAFGWVRYAWMPLLSKFPLTRTLMVSTMCGIQRGFFKRSLAPMPELAKILR